VFEDLKLLMAALLPLDRAYAEEAGPLARKYAASDPAFAAKTREYLG
jgi:hypothetical protein